MTGIYIHIPFCAQACTYCNFHFSASLKKKDEFLLALHKEIEIRGNESRISTIYFGGGTPSILSNIELDHIFQSLGKSFDIRDVQEVTLEINPEDMTPDYLMSLKDQGVNRLSIGIQSFFNDDLGPMRRIHNAEQARIGLEEALRVNFDSLSIDLIYGIPWSPQGRFQQNLDLVNSYNIPHLSPYALTIEEKTALAHQIKMGQQKNVDDNTAFEDFQTLQNWARTNGYIHYEISNLCKPGSPSQHNSSYWSGKPYIGFGPSAHSYDGKIRSWNIANNIKYIKSLSRGERPSEEEVIKENDRYNEWIMTGLRLHSGIEIMDLDSFNSKIQTHFFHEIKEKVNRGILLEENGHLSLNENQRFFADGHASDLFYLNDI